MTVIHRIDLDLGVKLGSGAQGDLYHVDAIRTPVRVAKRDALPDPLVFKEFHAGTAVSGPALEGLTRFRASLPDDERQVLDTMTVWPCAVVHDGSERPCGFLMGSIPPSFFQPIETTSGSERIPREIQELFVSEAIARKNFGETANGVERLALARDMAFIIGFLHKRDFVYGDLSYKNAVFCLRPHPGVILLDCDAVRRMGESAGVPQLHSPGWKPPESGPQTKATDRYKLGLFVLRVLTPGVNAQNRDPDKARGHLDDAGMSLLRRALGDDPDQRTTGKEWVQYFNARIAAAGGVRTRTGAAARPHRPTARRAPAHPGRGFVARPTYRPVAQPARVGPRPLQWQMTSPPSVMPIPNSTRLLWRTASGPTHRQFMTTFIVLIAVAIALVVVGNVASTPAPTNVPFRSTTTVDPVSTNPVTPFGQSAAAAVTGAKKYVNAIDQRPVGVALAAGQHQAVPTDWIVQFTTADPDRSTGHGVWTIRNIQMHGGGFTELPPTTVTGERLAGLSAGWAAGLERAAALYPDAITELRYACNPSGNDCYWVIGSSAGDGYFDNAGTQVGGPPTWLQTAN
jgi:hypothetical protein